MRTVSLLGVFIFHLCITPLLGNIITKEQTLTGINKKGETHTIPFELYGNLIVIEGIIDQQKGYIIIDSGSSDVIINSRFFKNKREKNNHYYADDLVGSARDMKSVIVRLQINDLLIKNQEAFSMNLSHLEKSKKLPIIGVIGYSLLKRFEITIDFEKKELIFHKLNARGKRKNAAVYFPSICETFQLKKSRHLFYINATIDGTPLKLGLDLGAENTVFEKAVISKHANNYNPISSILITSFQGKKKGAIGELKNVRIGNNTINLKNVILTDLRSLNTHLIKSLDGLLGNDFLSQFKITLNFKKQTLSLCEYNLIVKK